jgi:hypothetical protein
MFCTGTPLHIECLGYILKAKVLVSTNAVLQVDNEARQEVSSDSRCKQQAGNKF